MSDDSDEYAAFNDFLGLTEEDFAQIDALSRAHCSIADPDIRIELEGHPAPERALHPSPMEQFRKSKTLSVTDLVSPAWYVLRIRCPRYE